MIRVLQHLVFSSLTLCAIPQSSEHYNPMFLPLSRIGDILNIRINFMLTEVRVTDDVAAYAHIGLIYSVTYNSTVFKGAFIDRKDYKLAELWTPPIFWRQQHVLFGDTARCYKQTGRVSYTRIVHITAPCRMREMDKFPRDTRVCEITIELLNYGDPRIRLQCLVDQGEECVQVDPNPMRSSNWRLAGPVVTIDNNTVKGARLTLRRKRYNSHPIFDVSVRALVSLFTLGQCFVPVTSAERPLVNMALSFCGVIQLVWYERDSLVRYGKLNQLLYNWIGNMVVNVVAFILYVIWVQLKNRDRFGSPVASTSWDMAKKIWLLPAETSMATAIITISDRLLFFFGSIAMAILAA